MKYPNFFIIGAPKCGTTSMAAWLSEHPNIYMSPIKEPLYYCTDFNCSIRYDIPRSRLEYEQLFLDATDEHLAVGEASVWYLYSRTAVPNIEREHPNSRYIVMLRNPVEMAYSLYDELCFWGHEHTDSFQMAWRLSPDRRAGRCVKRHCRIPPQWLDYQQVCLLGDQLERVLGLVPRQRILVIIFDDLKNDPKREYLRVLSFLGVPDDGREDFPVHNPARKARSRAFQRATRLIKNTVAIGSRGVKQILGIPKYKSLRIITPLLFKMEQLNVCHRPRPHLDGAFRQELVEYYREDVRKLSKLLGRDLSEWWNA